MSTPKERPILFSGPMVLALLANRKTQTRRVVKTQPQVSPCGRPFYFGDEGTSTPCPYGKPGDRLWVRETWAASVAYDSYAPSKLTPHVHNVGYRAGGGFDFEGGKERGLWRPSIFMPRWASRITLEIVEVRVERLQDISEADALAEGVSVRMDAVAASAITKGEVGPAQLEFYDLWQSINGPGSWELNPWVWAITFKPLT